MNLLLDTHVFLWFLNDDPLLSNLAKSLIEDPGNRKLISLVSCWEVVIKASNQKLHLGEAASTFLQREIKTNNFEVLGINLHHILHLEKLPHHHKDPFDRLLAVQVLHEGLQFLSADAIFDSYGITRRWN